MTLAPGKMKPIKRPTPGRHLMAHRHTKLSPLILLLVGLGLGAGCESETPTEDVNDAPVVQILQPGGALTVVENTAVIFRGSASDAEDGVLPGTALAWSSSLDGALGVGDSIETAGLSVGGHVVTLTASDSKGLANSASASVTVMPFVPGNQPPQVTITSPAPGSSVVVGTLVDLAGSATDPEDGPLTGAALVWTSSLDGALGTGTAVTTDVLSVGQHTITLTATDGDAASSAVSVSLTVTQTPLTLGLDTVVTGLVNTVFLTVAPNDPTRLFIIEKDGRIRIVKNGVLLTTPFLDITAKTTKGGEQGLLGMAFAPDYPTSGRFFVSYTAPGGGAAGHSVIARYQVSADPDVAGTTDVVVLTVDQFASNHNGGMIAFGPDGYLYFGLGDGGGGGDPQETGQDRSDLLGSMLRLDVSGATYTVPATNPYVDSTGYRAELWNYGLRNPWRWSFDRLTHDLYIADVGQGQHEEVNVVAANAGGGQDFGWDDMEGLACYEDANCASNTALRPVIDYLHTGGACSVTGGYVYRGSAIPALQGHYLYGDYCAGWVRSFRWVNGQAVDQADRPELSPGFGLTSFGEDGAGELYIVIQSGTVFRIVAR
jgi:glucose/arabinose dehydrogenase